LGRSNALVIYPFEKRKKKSIVTTHKSASHLYESLGCEYACVESWKSTYIEWHGLMFMQQNCVKKIIKPPYPRGSMLCPLIGVLKSDDIRDNTFNQKTRVACTQGFGIKETHTAMLNQVTCCHTQQEASSI
jgi:hypothetical protein